MSAIERAKEVYAKIGEDFDADIAKYRKDDIAVTTSKHVLLARATIMDGKTAWFIKCAVGDIRKLITMLPPLPFIAFRRSKSGGRQRLYRTDRFLRLVEGV